MAWRLLSTLQTIVHIKILLIGNTNAILSMGQDIIQGSFIWDEDKEALNKQVHGLDFTEACKAFFDPNRVIALDESHSDFEERFFCIGKVNEKCMTVRFTYRGEMIRIIGAGFWRKGRKRYEEENK